LAYQGPGLVRRIARELKQLLERDGFTKTIEAVGEG
jgi:dihydroorotate dehydrogenase